MMHVAMILFWATTALGLTGGAAAACTDPVLLKECENHFEDFQAVHSDQAPEIHWGHFILWHRYSVATYEKAPREECGYRAAQPSSRAVFQTEIFDELSGFGGGNGNYDISPLPRRRTSSI
ncbi:hypothetical protein EYZ11_005782 [Aspergillus tanneri]|uniref:Tyrosinase copper-binding domain-containing protein n=1 Tax=Aspergillus tanneri TaxID=1220188 RepID=A0A4S3JH98_9EURO|nr:hypothetical protein EYZ11_005782 [Aspergillus tanneri]